jgi:hypothetical protein
LPRAFVLFAKSAEAEQIIENVEKGKPHTISIRLTPAEYKKNEKRRDSGGNNNNRLLQGGGHLHDRNV